MRPTSVITLARLGLAATAALVALNAQATPSGVQAAFGNTVMSIYPDGGAQRIWLKPDSTWEALGRRGKWSSGVWSVKGQKVCLKQRRPFPAPFNYCTEFPTAGGVGAHWTSRDMTGVPINVTLVKGIDRPASQRP